MTRPIRLAGEERKFNVNTKEVMANTVSGDEANGASRRVCFGHQLALRSGRASSFSDVETSQDSTSQILQS